MIKNFEVFIGKNNIKRDGLEDLFGAYEKLPVAITDVAKELEKHQKNNTLVWVQIFDLELNKKVYHFNDEYLQTTKN